MKLIFLSNTHNLTNDSIKSQIIQVIGNSTKIAYLPTSMDSSRKYFNETQAFFKSFSRIQLEYFGLYEGEWTDEHLENIQTCDAIFISGGNTYNLLYHLKLRKLDVLIAEFAKSKPVIGVSAGAIVLTPSIDISMEECDFDLSDTNALNLIPFYFYPHYEGDIETNKELIQFIQKNQNLEIYLAPDNSAVFYNDGQVKTFGDVRRYRK